jgi:hypothetical protein
MNDRPWSTQDDADLKRMIREFRPFKEIASVLGRTAEDVQRWLKVLGSRMPGATSRNDEPD